MTEWLTSLGWNGGMIALIALPSNLILQTSLGMRFFGRHSRWMPNARPILHRAIAVTAPISAILTALELAWCVAFAVPAVLPMCKRIVGAWYGVQL